MIKLEAKLHKSSLFYSVHKKKTQIPSKFATQSAIQNNQKFDCYSNVRVKFFSKLYVEHKIFMPIFMCECFCSLTKRKLGIKCFA